MVDVGRRPPMILRGHVSSRFFVIRNDGGNDCHDGAKYCGLM